MTQLENAREGKITSEIEFVAKSEMLSPKFVARGIAKGTIVLPANNNHSSLKPIGIGKGLRTKINANIGNSCYESSKKTELEKLGACLEYGTDTVMDLSTGEDIDEIRKSIVSNSRIPVGTVPIYQAVVEGKSILDLSEKDILSAIEKQVAGGIDFITVHSGIRRKSLPLLSRRLLGVVSRGGSFLVAWMRHNNEENPFYTAFDDILEIAYRHDCTLSLGDGFRPGCIKDATDSAQISELKALGALAKRAKKENVQAMIEGPGHVPLNQIKRNILLQKKYCNNAPFYVLGPLVTDVAPGYDHITSAIGGAIAAASGADFLCYVTPAEHLRLPDLNDVKEGIIASRIAAHAGDLAKGVKGAVEWDNRMSLCRKNLDWKGMFREAIDPKKAESYHESADGNCDDACTMCGKYCAVKIYNESCKNKE